MMLLMLTAALAQSPTQIPITDAPMCDPVAPGLLDGATDALGRELACPICSGQSVSGSQTPVALGMKTIIHEALAQGYCPDQISDYFVSVYGDDVVLDPSTRGNSALLWGPLLGVLVGLLGAGIWWKRQPKTSDPEPQAPQGEMDPYQAQVLRELDE